MKLLCELKPKNETCSLYNSFYHFLKWTIPFFAASPLNCSAFSAFLFAFGGPADKWGIKLLRHPRRRLCLSLRAPVRMSQNFGNSALLFVLQNDENAGAHKPFANCDKCFVGVTDDYRTAINVKIRDSLAAYNKW